MPRPPPSSAADQSEIFWALEGLRRRIEDPAGAVLMTGADRPAAGHPAGGGSLMRRIISRLKPLRLVPIFFGAAQGVISLFGAVPDFIEAIPSRVVFEAILLGLVLVAVHRKAPEHEPHVMAAPVCGRWAALNTPGQQLPSHGSRFLGQYAAIDVLRPTTVETPAKIRKVWRNSRPRSIGASGRRCMRWPLASSLGRRLICAILGNHVIVRHDDGTAAVYAHLRRGTVLAEVGGTYPPAWRDGTVPGGAREGACLERDPVRTPPNRGGP